MPLAKPLPDLRHQLQEILTEDLAAALNALRELLPEGSEKHKQALALRARLNDANKERFRNTLSPDEYQRRVDTIRAACFDLIGDLEEGDFEAPASEGQAASARASAAKHGSVLYRVPHRMPLRKPTICTVRVAIDEEAILEDIVLDDDVRLRQRVEVSDMMRAELLDPEGDVFSIRQLSEPEQLVRETGYTQWLFSVTPRVEGEHQLLVKVSMMEYNANLGKYVPREVSILETVTIVTETTISDSDETPLKATGEHFTLGPDVADEASRPLKPPIFDILRPQTVFSPPSPVLGQPVSTRKSINRGLRATALLLAFLMVGTTATWAFTPPPVRDWWVASIKDDADAYAGYIEKYKDSDATQHLEKAYFRKADKTDALRDLRDYQREYPQGQFREIVLEKIETLEIRAVESIQQQPVAKAIMQFVQDFPESERLPELKQAVGNRAELLPVLENAYVASIQAQPSPRKVEAFLRDFSQSERLPEVAAAVASEPEVLRAVQPELDRVIVQKMENATTVAELQAVLPVLESAGSNESAKKLEQMAAQKPQLKKLLPQIRQVAERVQQREQQLSESSKLSESSQVSPTELQDKAQRDITEHTENVGDLEKRIQEIRDKKRLAIKNQQYEEAANLRDLEVKLVRKLEESKPKLNRRSDFEMVRVEGTAFTMGNHKDSDKDNCEHQVTVKTFEIGKYEVTQADWREVMGSDPPALYNKGCDDCPVEGVSWNDVQDFLKKLNGKTGKKYRLPTEVEWEYAARGGSKSKGYTYAGSNDIDKVAWYSGNYKVGNTFGAKKTTRPVGTKAPNELGIYDMSGNVYEWCQDKYVPYPGCSEPKETSVYPVLRGGSWINIDYFSRVSRRNYYNPNLRYYLYGFRLSQGY